MDGPLEPRARAEERERRALSPWASLAAESKGRDRAEPPDPLRTAFAVDRDRLAADAHVAVLAGRRARLDEPRSRLQRALLVGALARGLARALALNEDLVDAIALARPLGTLPLAEGGEQAAATVLDGGLSVPEQSLRVVERLAAQGQGLNLTWEVRDGILAQQRDGARTREGQTVVLAEEVLDAAERWAVARAPLPPAADGWVRPGCAPVELAGALLGDVASHTREDDALRFGPRGATVMGELRAARQAATASPARRDRAAHVVAALLVHEAEQADGDAQQAVDRVGGLTDAQALAAHRERFEPDLSD